MAILLATGLQHRDVDSVASELDIPVSQVLAFFNKTVRKIASKLTHMVEADVAKSLPSNKAVTAMEKKVKSMDRLQESLSQDQKADEKEFKSKQQQPLQQQPAGKKAKVAGASDVPVVLKSQTLTKHAVSSDRSETIDKVLSSANAGSRLGLISKRKTLDDDVDEVIEECGDVSAAVSVPATISIPVVKSSTDGDTATSSSKKKKDKKRDREQNKLPVNDSEPVAVGDEDAENKEIHEKKHKKHKK